VSDLPKNKGTTKPQKKPSNNFPGRVFVPPPFFYIYLAAKSNKLLQAPFVCDDKLEDICFLLLPSSSGLFYSPFCFYLPPAISFVYVHSFFSFLLIIIVVVLLRLCRRFNNARARCLRDKEAAARVIYCGSQKLLLLLFSNCPKNL